MEIKPPSIFASKVQWLIYAQRITIPILVGTVLSSNSFARGNNSTTNS